MFYQVKRKNYLMKPTFLTSTMCFISSERPENSLNIYLNEKITSLSFEISFIFHCLYWKYSQEESFNDTFIKIRNVLQNSYTKYV